MKLKTIPRWLLSLILVGAIATGSYIFLAETEILAQDTRPNAAQGGQQSPSSAVPIQPASAALGSVSASGNIALVSQRAVALEVSGVVDAIMVKAGDTVDAWDPLLSVDTGDLERAIRNAELSVRSIQNQIEQLSEEDTAADITVAEAALVQAQENLETVLAGPSSVEIAAAQSGLSAAWANYDELQAGPSQAELTQLSANLEKAKIAVAQAQSDYDQIAWQNNSGTTSQAAALQSATIDYEAAQAAYEESIAAASTSSLQSALSAAQNAQAQLDALLNSSTEAEIAAAAAAVIEAQANLDDLLAGPAASEVTALEIDLEQALLSLEQAHTDLTNSIVSAPIAGTVLTVNATVGEHYSEGAVVVTLADTQQLELTIHVAEVDIAEVAVGQHATIEIDALAGQSFGGIVEHIAPINDADASIVSYAVTIYLDEESLVGVLPGMTAVATMVNDDLASSGWLVPTNAILQQGDSSIVTVVTEEGTISVEVIPGAVRGEWTIVESASLQAGDQVQGSITSFVDSEAGGGAPGLGGRGAGGLNGGFSGGGGR